MGSTDVMRGHPAAAAASESRSSTDLSASSGVYTLQALPLRILVVDDERHQADSLAEVLESIGHTARIAYDGYAALAMAPQFVADVALLDVGLPGMSGYQLAAELRQLLGDAAPVFIALSGYDRSSDRERSAAAGFAAHLGKPFDLGRLEAMLARIAPLAITALRTGS